MRNLTTEETIGVRKLMAERCGLALTQSGVYLLDGEEFCEEGEWQPDFDDSHAVMVLAAFFLVGDIQFNRLNGGMVYKCTGICGADKPVARSAECDSLSEAVYKAACFVLEREGKL
jgi:hypothetical protein